MQIQVQFVNCINEKNIQSISHRKPINMQQTLYYTVSNQSVHSIPTTAYNQYKPQRILPTDQIQLPQMNYYSLCLWNKQVHWTY